MQIKELYSHTTNDITVYVEIDYANNKISLVDRNNGYKDKKWLFACRGIEYMNGWLNILESMKLAIKDAKKKLGDYQAEREKEKLDFFLEMDKEIDKLTKINDTPRKRTKKS